MSLSRKWKRILVSAVMASLLALSASAASASKLHPCNSGAGNGIENCDPGNSGPKDG